MANWLDTADGQAWAAQFAAEHNGMKPGEQGGEDLRDALANLAWSRNFAETNGRAPNEQEWQQATYSRWANDPEWNKWRTVADELLADNGGTSGGSSASSNGPVLDYDWTSAIPGATNNQGGFHPPMSPKAGDTGSGAPGGDTPEGGSSGGVPGMGGDGRIDSVFDPDYQRLLDSNIGPWASGLGPQPSGVVVPPITDKQASSTPPATSSAGSGGWFAPATSGIGPVAQGWNNAPASGGSAWSFSDPSRAATYGRGQVAPLAGNFPEGAGSVLGPTPYSAPGGGYHMPLTVDTQTYHPDPRWPEGKAWGKGEGGEKDITGHAGVKNPPAPTWSFQKPSLHGFVPNFIDNAGRVIQAGAQAQQAAYQHPVAGPALWQDKRNEAVMRHAAVPAYNAAYQFGREVAPPVFQRAGEMYGYLMGTSNKDPFPWY